MVKRAPVNDVTFAHIFLAIDKADYPVTASEIMGITGYPKTNVGYAIIELLEMGCVTFVDTVMNARAFTSTGHGCEFCK